MLNAAEEAGLLQPGGTIVEQTSGNTGIGLAAFAAEHGSVQRFVLYGKMCLIDPSDPYTTMNVKNLVTVEIFSARFLVSWNG